ncbi:hypothetical protein IF1G_03593 [Cordyceps javanica]|uniref:Uncharacterized protein n=1 Tax=Cordyceps javanica TaxID=43265 RepID=A0A545V802_9HYPO|nr:hypothetical protein IF1G_03593 [Cordyceps javanica]
MPSQLLFTPLPPPLFFEPEGRRKREKKQKQKKKKEEKRAGRLGSRHTDSVGMACAADRVRYGWVWHGFTQYSAGIFLLSVSGC